MLLEYHSSWYFLWSLNIVANWSVMSASKLVKILENASQDWGAIPVAISRSLNAEFWQRLEKNSPKRALRSSPDLDPDFGWHQPSQIPLFGLWLHWVWLWTYGRTVIFTGFSRSSQEMTYLKKQLNAIKCSSLACCRRQDKHTTRKLCYHKHDRAMRRQK